MRHYTEGWVFTTAMLLLGLDPLGKNDSDSYPYTWCSSISLLAEDILASYHSHREGQWTAALYMTRVVGRDVWVHQVRTDPVIRGLVVEKFREYVKTLPRNYEE